jgi:hypothetical protein
VKETPIIMQGESVRAIDARIKVQTRRLIKADVDTLRILSKYSGWTWSGSSGGHGGVSIADAGGTFSVPLRCPYGAVGDRLYTKESVAIRSDVDPAIDLDKALHYLIYRADYRDGDLSLEWHNYGRGWISPLFMPRWASRLTLEITEVRVQRLQEISEDDARAEGCDWHDADIARTIGLHRIAFAKRWDAINSKRRRREYLSPSDPGYTADRPWRTVVDESAAWAANPFVWAMTFRRIP